MTKLTASVLYLTAGFVGLQRTVWRSRHNDVWDEWFVYDMGRCRSVLGFSLQRPAWRGRPSPDSFGYNPESASTSSAVVLRRGRHGHADGTHDWRNAGDGAAVRRAHPPGVAEIRN